jgi:phosphoribosylaminoimidazole-succinocarboxamide synthase
VTELVPDPGSGTPGPVTPGPEAADRVFIAEPPTPTDVGTATAVGPGPGAEPEAADHVGVGLEGLPGGPAHAGLTGAVRHRYSGKVRDLYDIDGGLLLLVASDRLSAFDVVLREPIPDKGRVLTAMTVFWTSLVADLAPTHLVSVVDETPSAVTGLPDGYDPAELVGRAVLVREAEMLPLECIVRGYVSGSAWKEYRTKGTIHGEPAPPGLAESDRLPEAVFTPSTKAAEGHDVNLSFEAACDVAGKESAEAARDLCLSVYHRAAGWAEERGIIIADTKFELGWIDGKLSICDEILTPDSSRFWPADSWAPGATPPSLDKQPVRDWLDAGGWDRNPPPPALAAEVVTETRSRYIDAYERLTGRSFAEWPGVTP